jgi:hypothetical protein
LDQIYDLVESNIASDIRGKISALPEQIDHPLAQRVAKAICLLQYVQSVHRSAENIAAALYPSVGAESQLPAVRAALDELLQRHQVRLGDDGYRIPTPTEDDWERQRTSLMPKGGDTRRIYVEAIQGLWRPQPDHNFLGTKLFKAGLVFDGHTLLDGDIPVHVQFADEGKDFAARAAELRSRSQTERTAIFWITALDAAIDREVVEIHRSQEMLSRKDRGAQTKEEARLVSDEQRRLQTRQDNLRRLLRLALLRGSIYFRGNDRSPGESAVDVGRVVTDLLRVVLPEVYDRFAEAAARVQARDLEVLLTAENLQGLTPLFSKLGLLKSQGNKVTFDVEHGPLAEVLARITNRANYGDSATGRYLTEELAKDPFGWEFEMVRLLTAALLRAGKLEMTTKGQIVETATTLEARNTFQNNNLFRQATFRPRTSTLEFRDQVAAAEAYKQAFGQDVAGLEIDVLAAAVRNEIARHEPGLQEMHNLLLRHSLPGASVLSNVLDQMRGIRTSRDEPAIRSFTAVYATIKEAIRRAAELHEALTAPRLHLVEQARVTLNQQWPFLRDEPDGDPAVAAAADNLADLLERETFYREWPAIDAATASIRRAYDEREAAALAARRTAYCQALAQLQAMPAWEQIEPAQQDRVAEPLRRYAGDGVLGTPIPQLRADTDACTTRLSMAVETLLQLLEGNRLVKVAIAPFFRDGVETVEDLEAALEGLRAAIEPHLAEGKKVLVQ